MAAAEKHHRFPCGLSLLLGLACTVGPAAAVFGACPAAQSGSVIAGTTIVDLSMRSASLLEVVQSAGDVEMYVDSAAPFWANGPGDRNSRDYLLLERALHGGLATLCFYPVFEQAASGDFAISELALEETDAGLIEALRPLNTAGTLWQSGTAANIEQAGKIYEALSRISLPRGNQFEFDVRLFAAIAKVKLLRYDDAIPDLHALLVEQGDHPDIYKVHFQLGKIYLRQRDIEEAIMHLEQARALLDSADPGALAWLRYERSEIQSWLGEAYVHARDLDTADATLDLAIRDAGADFALLGRIFDNKGLVGIRRGEVPGISREERARWYELSTEDHLKGIYFSQAAGDRETLQVTENNIAIHYARVGERRKSIVHFLNVLRMLDEVDNPEWRGLLLGNLSNYLQILGDYSKSLAYLEQAIQFASPLANAGYSTYFCRMGNLLDLLEEPASAVAQYQRCLELALQYNDPDTQIEARLQLSKHLLAEGKQAEAEQMFQPGLQALAAVTNFQLLKRAWTHQARLLLAAGRPSDADAAIKRAFAADLNEQFPNQTIEALELAMRIQLALAQTENAFALGERAMAMIETLHAQLEAERMGPAWSSQSSSLYETVAAAYLEQYRGDADPVLLRHAFRTMERSRDISLRQRLSAALPNDSATLEEEKRLERYSSLSNLLAQSGSDEPLPAMNALEYYHQHDLLSLARLNNLDVIAVPEPVTIQQVQQRLTGEQLVLYYVATGERLHVLVITPHDFSLARSVSLTEVEALLAEADLAVQGTNSVAVGLLRQLSPLLLPDLAAWPEATELLIVPHTGLYTLPFAALTRAAGGARYEPLIASHTLRTLPSLSSYFMSKPQRDVAYSTGVAILANPVFGNLQLAALAPSESATSELWRGWSNTLRPLPYTAREAANIAGQFPGRTMAYTGSAANRRNLSSAQARNAKVLHIATHGYFKSTSEDNLGLALSTVDEEGNADPGFITLTELFGYAFNNQLVVISGCETAMGKELAGVGLNGLTRGFLAQGVRHVISTLWPVSDRASAEFMRAFYRNLDSSKDVATALQQTQLELARHPDYRNPYYWAGYVLTTVTPDATVDLAL
jgi:CHAT domain-containing protein/tetratricopeptide (TPR) repeat protein